MRFHKYFGWVVGLIVLTTSCNPADNSKKLSVYFDFKGLLDEQISLLKEKQPTVIKKVVLDGNEEQLKMQPNVDHWVSEFEIFEENDINKPAFVGSFEENVEEDVLRYNIKDEAANGVKTFEVVFFPGTEVPQSIDIKSSTRNSLYQSNRRLTINFQNKSGSPLISSYVIKGDQTILSGEPTFYQLNVELIY